MLITKFHYKVGDAVGTSFCMTWVIITDDFNTYHIAAKFASHLLTLDQKEALLPNIYLDRSMMTLLYVKNYNKRQWLNLWLSPGDQGAKIAMEKSTVFKI